MFSSMAALCVMMIGTTMMPVLPAKCLGMVILAIFIFYAVYNEGILEELQPSGLLLGEFQKISLWTMSSALDQRILCMTARGWMLRGSAGSMKEQVKDAVHQGSQQHNLLEVQWPRGLPVVMFTLGIIQCVELAGPWMMATLCVRCWGEMII